jgi:flagellar protein FlbT
MSLIVELKPGERVIVGECVITNSDQRTRFRVDGKVPILREKDIMTPQRANTPARRLYLAVQLMYVSRDPRPQHELYFSLVREFVQAVPSAWPQIELINNHILTGEMYKALKAAKKLIAYEQELIEHARSSTSVRQSGQANGTRPRSGS